MNKVVILLFQVRCLFHSILPSGLFCCFMEAYRLYKRIVLSFETKRYEDGETDYTYIMDMLGFCWMYS